MTELKSGSVITAWVCVIKRGSSTDGRKTDWGSANGVTPPVRPFAWIPLFGWERETLLLRQPFPNWTNTREISHEEMTVSSRLNETCPFFVYWKVECFCHRIIPSALVCFKSRRRGLIQKKKNPGRNPGKNPGKNPGEITIEISFTRAFFGLLNQECCYSTGKDPFS